MQSTQACSILANALDASLPSLYLTDKLFNYLVHNTMPTTDRLSVTFAALADPTRRAILARLALGETSVSKLAKPFSMSLPAVSKHLKVLERAGLITRSRDAQMRPCKIEPTALKEVDDWFEEYRQLWEQRLDRLDDYLKTLQARDNADQPQAKPREKKDGRRKQPRS
jgi:DNA-binding transcriptional ArsR family regulator